VAINKIRKIEIIKYEIIVLDDFK